ncbi:MAG: DEAD/DEAH box helicase, partial [Desulfatitalea sp.]|nr:DEAD/DEAH box helicase [Desulfatitalea sp.]NNK01817.1 DEAD/DEAH box helicase [Desulfatitalea sp.]
MPKSDGNNRKTGDVGEYVQAMRHAARLAGQVAAHHSVPAHPAQWCPMSEAITLPTRTRLAQLGIQQLYSHQNQAVEAICQGRHTVVATPTASGKSMIYNIPVVQAVDQDPSARALYLFPLKALAQDQLAAFQRFARTGQSAQAPEAAIYDGDTTAYRRKKIRQQPPHVLITNPEMLHLALLPYHDTWRRFFSRLEFVVIDEVHTFRGMLGAHMAQVLRRLRRIARLYGSAPVFIFTSATVANPGVLASRLTDLPVHTIERSGAPRGARHMVLINPSDGPSQTAILLLKAALARGLRTIMYTQSRKMAELIALWSRRQAGQWADVISVYRAGLTPEDRRHIEQRMRDGHLLAVISTSALELGIDIGDLDLCILVGYPGSMIATWQRSGRVGRKGQAAALVMIAGDNALDQFYIAHPRMFWEGRPETAVFNPYNRVALEAHLACAAAESVLSPEESWLQHPLVLQAVARLEGEGQLMRSADGAKIAGRQRRPHRRVSLRGMGERFRLVDAVDETAIGEMDEHRLYRETHPGAVYLHLGRTY